MPPVACDRRLWRRLLPISLVPVAVHQDCEYSTRRIQATDNAATYNRNVPAWILWRHEIWMPTIALPGQQNGILPYQFFSIQKYLPFCYVFCHMYTAVYYMIKNLLGKPVFFDDGDKNSQTYGKIWELQHCNLLHVSWKYDRILKTTVIRVKTSPPNLADGL